jgi:membrane protein
MITADGKPPDRPNLATPLRRVVEVLVAFASFVRYLAVRFWNDKCFSASASLSYTTLLSLVPLAAIGFAILTAFPVFDQIRADIQTFVLSNFLPQNVEAIREQFDRFLRNTRELTALGTVALAVTAVILLDTVDTYYNRIWRESEVRPLLQRILMYWTILTLTPLLVGGSVALSTLLFTRAELATIGAGSGVTRVLLGWLPTLLLLGAVALSYFVIPYRRIVLGHALLGAVVAALLYDVLKWGFTLYFRLFPSYQALYGAVAVIPLLLVWLYLVWCAVLLGAEIAAALPEWLLTRRLGQRSHARPTVHLTAALSLLHGLYLGSKDGLPIETEALTANISEEAGSAERVLETLHQAHMIARSNEDSWVLSRDPSDLTVDEVAHALGIKLEPGLGDAAQIPAWLARLDRLIGEADAEMRATLGLSLRALFEDTPPVGTGTKATTPAAGQAG